MKMNTKMNTSISANYIISKTV